MVRHMENVSNRKYSNIAISNEVFVRISQDPCNRVTLQCQQPRINEFSFAACKNISFFPSMKGSGFLLNNLKHLSEHIRNKYGFTLSSRRITIGSCLKIVSSAHQTWLKLMFYFARQRVSLFPLIIFVVSYFCHVTSTVEVLNVRR